MRYECPECGEEVDEEDVNFDCLFCGQTDQGEGFYICEYCGALFDYEEILWKCEFCHNGSRTEESEKMTQKIIIEEYIEFCPQCGEKLEDPNYCYSCGWPDNLGWIGENYG